MTTDRAGQRALKRLFIVLLFLILSSCSMYSVVRAGRDINIGRVFTVESPVTWTKLKENGVEIWSIDGPQLQRLFFFKGVEDGRPLMKMSGERYNDMPLYHSSMTPIEIGEFIEATLSRSGASRIAIKDLRPLTFAGMEGFRFELSYYTKNGLKYDGFFTGARKENRLLAIVYIGTSLYHYKKHLADVERIVSSAVVSSSFQ